MTRSSAKQSGIETIEMLQQDRDPLAKWTPAIGPETLDFFEHLAHSDPPIPAGDIDKLREEAISVLSRCVPPTAPQGTDTGLIIGYVQSGKTMSFTAVAALAKDNGYKLIIVITGITRNLFQQSTDRLEDDLLRTRQDRKWQFLPNPKSRPDIRHRIETAIESTESTPGLGSQTVLITVMKNRTHLDNLITLLRAINLRNIPTLIIDDEADQASLNNQVRRGRESATYRRIIDLRRLFPHHTFLQYTATPQALLLINLIDILSPSFAELLTAGHAYTGGKTFFERDFSLIRPIPLRDIPTKDHILTSPPSSLITAMQIFFLGVAIGFRDGSKGNRSMMVHPSKETMQHANYAHWIRQIQQRWQRTLALDSQDPDLIGLLGEFRSAYNDLHSTVQNLPDFDGLIPFLGSAVKTTIVTEVNAAGGPTPQIDWKQDYAHILVGGDVLNRGYTIRGMTITYMPRGRGVGNADTIEQRARWFGYKAGYLGYCRVYLADATRLAYQNYVQHEENIRKQLLEHRESARSLQEWRRAFFLSPNLRPTRNDVIDLDYMRGNFASAWYQPHAPHLSDHANATNQQLVQQLRETLSWQPDIGSEKRTKLQKHLVSHGARLQLVYSEFLTKLQVVSTQDSQRFTGLLLQVGRYLESNPDAECTLYLMSSGQARDRRVGDDNRYDNLFEGEYPDAPPDQKGTIYPGDRNIRDLHTLTVQIHSLNVTQGVGSSRKILARDVPAVAVWVPREMSADWLVQ